MHVTQPQLPGQPSILGCSLLGLAVSQCTTDDKWFVKLSNLGSPGLEGRRKKEKFLKMVPSFI